MTDREMKLRRIELFEQCILMSKNQTAEIQANTINYLKQSKVQIEHWQGIINKIRDSIK